MKFEERFVQCQYQAFVAEEAVEERFVQYQYQASVAEEAPLTGFARSSPRRPPRGPERKRNYSVQKASTRRRRRRSSTEPR